MPVLGFALLAGIARYVLVSLGVGLVTFVGVEALLGSATSLIKASMQSDSVVAGFAGLLGLDRAISIILSAYAVRVALSTLKSFKVL